MQTFLQLLENIIKLSDVKPHWTSKSEKRRSGALPQAPRRKDAEIKPFDKDAAARQKVDRMVGDIKKIMGGSERDKYNAALSKQKTGLDISKFYAHMPGSGSGFFRKEPRYAHQRASANPYRTLPTGASGKRTIADLKRGLPPDAKVKKTGNNRIVINYADGRRAYRLHHTDIVTVHPNGNVEFNDGGYPTVTTRKAWGEAGRALGIDINTRVHSGSETRSNHALSLGRAKTYWFDHKLVLDKHGHKIMAEARDYPVNKWWEKDYRKKTKPKMQGARYHKDWVKQHKDDLKTDPYYTRDMEVIRHLKKKGYYEQRTFVGMLEQIIDRISNSGNMRQQFTPSYDSLLRRAQKDALLQKTRPKADLPAISGTDMDPDGIFARLNRIKTNIPPGARQSKNVIDKRNEKMKPNTHPPGWEEGTP